MEQFQNYFLQIVDLTKCLICLSTIKNSYSCPSCLKSFCLNCIKEWLQKEQKCPNCRNYLTESRLQKNKFMDELLETGLKWIPTTATDKGTPLFKKMCSLHSKAKEYYCIDCSSLFCSDCVIFSHDKSHCFLEKNDLDMNEVTSLINKTIEIDSIIEELKKNEQLTIEEKINDCKQKMNKQMEHLELLKRTLKIKYSMMEKEIRNSSTTMKDKITTLYLKKDTIKNVLKDFIHTKNKKNIETNGNYHLFLNKNTSISKSLQDINEDLIQLNTKEFNSLSKISFFTLHYDFISATFEIKNFASYLTNDKGDFLYLDSPITKLNFLSWKIRVYPSNIEKSKKYLAVFLYLMEGSKDIVYHYNYRIELIGKNSYKLDNIGHFKEGTQEGYATFYEIDQLMSSDFINSKGSLCIRYSVCPLNQIEFLKEVNYYNEKYAVCN